MTGILQMPVTVWRLTLAYALVMSGTSMMVLTAGIIGPDFAPLPGLATLPVACVIVGVASGTLPTGRLLTQWGRRRVFVANGMLACLAALTAYLGLKMDGFALFCLAALMMGWSAAAGHQYRFAAFDAVSAELAPRATSMLLLGGILSAIIGPELALLGRSLLATPFAGSFLLLAVAYALGTLIIAFNRDGGAPAVIAGSAVPAMRSIMVSPILLLAVSAAATAYGVMSFLMTASPISMHHHAGLGLTETKWVIQSHIVAMYLPSLFFAPLLKRFGFAAMMYTGVAACAGAIALAASGVTLNHYWPSLVLLGLGWNFLFLSATNLLPRACHGSSRFRIQAANDFVVFTVQAFASLSAAWFLLLLGWRGLSLAMLPVLAIFLVLAWRWLPAIDENAGRSPVGTS